LLEYRNVEGRAGSDFFRFNFRRRKLQTSAPRVFALGRPLLFIALVSPLHWLSEQLFVAHMIEHEILMVAAAPLIVVAQPFGAMMWGLPQTLRVPLGRLLQSAPVVISWGILTEPRVAALLHGLAIWAWHMPSLFDAALGSSWLHWIQHLSFLLTALLFWWALLRANARHRAYAMSIFVLFVTMLHCSLLGILISLARRPLCASEPAAFGWDISRMADQQAAGLVMWIPPGIIYTTVALVFVVRWMADVSNHPRHHTARSSQATHGVSPS
jgi:putative membrane protein